jgi:mono/diheme cytochrome c family protein
MSAQRYVVALAALVALLALAGCRSTGVYPLETFVEMHYSPAYRGNEPPRLSPPADAVPVTGPVAGYQLAPDPQTAAQVQNPLQANQQNLQAGARLYQVNCRVCHGPEGAGNGPMVGYFQNPPQGVPRSVPSNLREVVPQRNDGQLYLTISNGGLNMPPFGRLLTSDQIWAVILHLRTFR